MAGRFELSKGKAGTFRFRLHSGNKRVILTSEVYSSRAAALAGINAVRQSSKKRERFERRISRSGKTYFVLLAANGAVIGQSQLYAHDTSAYVGIRSVIANAGKAPLRNGDKT